MITARSENLDALRAPFELDASVCVDHRSNRTS